ncbi:MAG: family 10 glycosylhydrolase [Armatimonadota bacterium]
MTQPNSQQLLHVDCTAGLGADSYFEHGETHVVESALGVYREAAGKPMERFGYRFKIENPGKPHVAIIRYPDDKRRHMCIYDGTSYDLTTGVFAGPLLPVSGEMQEIRLIFWPRWRDCSIIFMTWSQNEPAAVADFEIREIDELPMLEIPPRLGSFARRELGIQYEDPCGIGASEGAVDREQWSGRFVDYALHSGQKLLKYPIVWYHGPVYPSQVEPASNTEVVVAEDRLQYIRWDTHPSDWVASLLRKCEEAGLEFVANLTLIRLGSLMEKMNTDLESIKGGVETINNVLRTNQVQAGTMDWTIPYDVRNYPGLLGNPDALFDKSVVDWPYGEQAEADYRPGPIFNPLHPTVQESILRLVGEIVERYGSSPAFKGLSFNAWHSTIIWFASLNSGYDDFTVSLFERETGIEVPVDKYAADRFSKRFEYLTYHCPDAWIDWRCRKIRKLLRKIRDVARANRPDLNVTITLWMEATMPQLLGPLTAAHQLYSRKSTYEIYQEGGIDIALYRDEPGIEIDLQMEPARDKGSNEERTYITVGESAPLEKCCMFRDHDFLDQETLGHVRDLQHSGAFIFNSWVEAWGKHCWFPASSDDENVERLLQTGDKPAEGIFRINSEYPEDGFWWDSQLRIIPALPGGHHFLEHYAHAVAELDALRITRGGLFLEKAHTEQIQRFALAYTALPARKFDDVGSSTDPVVVRKITEGGAIYIYAVNREYYPIAVEMQMGRSGGDLIDLATGEKINVSSKWPIVLQPYELRSFRVEGNFDVLGFTSTPPEEIVRDLQQRAEAALEAISRTAQAGMNIPGMEKIREGIESALVEGRIAWLRRALGCYIVRKCHRIAS